jgi:oxygen-independent coproporphyrinogen-3 oxidase
VPGVYISYPFCSQKCTFCNFASGVSTAAGIAGYCERLTQEIRVHDWAWQPETVYFGGGTPSLMAPDLLARLLSLIPRQKVTEATLECAPGTITPERLRAWVDCGIDRLSLGVQSFVSTELRQTGRRHTAEAVARDIAALRAAGITNINVDLIAGLPGQTRASWDESLDWIERLAPPHVSVYIFEIDEDSRLGKEALLGGVRYGADLLPCDDLTAELYERAVTRLAAFGIHRYEISNFARPGLESRHNLKYWLLEPYIGFGLDAHSFDGRVRWSNPDTLGAYCANGSSERVFTPTDHDEEQFFVGLRLTRGIEPTAAQWAKFAVPIEKWHSAGMLEREGNRLRLSEQGILVSNEIFQEFLLA